MSSVLCNQTITGSLSLSGTLTLSAASLPTLQIGSSNTYKIQRDTVSGNTLDIYSGNAMGPTLEMNSSKESTFYGNVTLSGLNSDLICSSKVGIGTTSPSRALQVIGTDGAAKFYYNSSFTNAQYSVVDVGMMTSGTAGNGFGPKITFRMGGNGYDGFTAGAIGTVRNGADGTHNMTFATSTSNSLSTKMTIKNDGKVGINTTSPSTQLHVVGTIRGGGSTDYIELDTNGNIKFADTSAGILPAANGTQTLSIGTTMTGNWDTIRHYFDNEVVWNPGSFGLPDDMNLDTSGNLSIGGDFTVSGGDITLGGTGRIQGVDTVSASTDAANKAYVDAHTPTNTQTILFSNFSDDSSSTSAFRIPFNTLSETTSNQYYNHFDCPSSGTIKRIRLNNTSGSPSTGFTVIFDIWRSASGSPTQSSSSITVASGGVVEYDPDLTFSKGDEIQIGFRKSSTSRYLRGVSASIIIEFEQA